MTRVVDAFEKLLDDHPYESITITDIARESRTGASSIYARFKDKRSILLAVHERVRERATSHFEEVYTPVRWADMPIEDAIRLMCVETMRWYRDHHNVIKASILLNDDVIYERIADSVNAGSVQLAYFIQARIGSFSKVEAVRTADVIFRIMTAAFQQITIFDRVLPTKQALSDEEVLTGVVRAALAQLFPERLERQG
ncbi:TetR/AcrR family transcriptional regulator [Sphingomonas colocasiae]|uniref:TetR/AcrR family transcriptional regulator n=1 Tax=Sphingomonas colocasiae TaxID=1848973 RepID=A0ABS7PPY8_9SPHN|nr:TetR/AcrR family transcriptional regulator [Sphingomonas colocasiae]MBY8823391.1 TetR/AcrR family transcriptional regulator [Sphingomonas colocasiae]